MQIRKAQKGRQKLRMGLVAPTGGGKTWTALLFATELVKGTGLRIGVIDTERESAELYADHFDFDVIPLTDSHDPRKYIEALKTFAEDGSYGCVVIDSASHAWMGKDGIQEQLDKYAKKNRGDSFGGWREMTPLHNSFVDAMLAAPFHLIVTLRAKMEYVRETDDKGKTVIRKVGMQPVQRDGMEYEFTIVCDMTTDHDLIVGKTRCNLVDGMLVNRPNGEFAKILRNWLEDGAEKPLPSMPAPPAPNGNGGTDDGPSFAQRELLAKLQKSHVFTESERAATQKTLEKHNTKRKAQELIDWSLTQIRERKAAEKRATAGMEQVEEPEVDAAMAAAEA